MRGIGREERDGAAACPLFVRALRITLGDRSFVERLSDDRRRVLHHAAYELAQPNFAGRAIGQGPLHPIDLDEIGITPRVGVIGLVQAEERPVPLSPQARCDDP